MCQALGHGPVTPGEILRPGGGTPPALVLIGNLQQPLGGIGMSVEYHVFHAFAQRLRQFVVHGELAGVNDTHVHAGLGGMVQKHGVDGLAHGVVAAEGKGHITDTPGNQGVRKCLFYLLSRFDKVDSIIIVFINSCGDGKDIGVEDNVFGRNAHLLGQNPVGPGTNLDLACLGVGLAGFVEGHDDHGGAVLAAQPGMVDEHGLPLLHADGIHHPLALDALEPGLDDRPLGGVDHHGHPGDVRLRGAEIQEGGHGHFALQHGLVHVDVDHLRAVLDLASRDFERLVILPFQDQALKSGGTGDIGTLADVHEQRILADVERLEPRQPRGEVVGP